MQRVQRTLMMQMYQEMRSRLNDELREIQPDWIPLPSELMPNRLVRIYLELDRSLKGYNYDSKSKNEVCIVDTSIWKNG